MLKEVTTSQRQSQQEQRKAIETHEKVKKLVGKLAATFQEIQRLDEETPVGMGGGVREYLEGFLEEILVRVEVGDE